MRRNRSRVPSTPKREPATRCTPSCAANSVNGVLSGVSSSTQSTGPGGGVDAPPGQFARERGDQRVATGDQLGPPQLDDLVEPIAQCDPDELVEDRSAHIGRGP